nr:MAG TPA: hypothetical protein [Inoviridae sp.]
MPIALLTGGAGTATGMEQIGTVTTFIWSEIGDVVTTIVSTPLLLIPVGIFVAGACIGLAKRFIGR